MSNRTQSWSTVNIVRVSDRSLSCMRSIVLASKRLSCMSEKVEVAMMYGSKGRMVNLNVQIAKIIGICGDKSKSVAVAHLSDAHGTFFAI